MMPPTVEILIKHYTNLPLRRLFAIVASPPGYQSLDSIYAAMIALERRNALWILDYLEPGLHAIDRVPKPSGSRRPPRDYTPFLLGLYCVVKFAVVLTLSLV